MAAYERELWLTHHFAIEGLDSLTQAAGKTIRLHSGLLEDLLQSRVQVQYAAGLFGLLGLLNLFFVLSIVGHLTITVRSPFGSSWGDTRSDHTPITHDDKEYKHNNNYGCFCSCKRAWFAGIYDTLASHHYPRAIASFFLETLFLRHEK